MIGLSALLVAAAAGATGAIAYKPVYTPVSVSGDEGNLGTAFLRAAKLAGYEVVDVADLPIWLRDTYGKDAILPLRLAVC